MTNKTKEYLKNKDNVTYLYPDTIFCMFFYEKHITQHNNIYYLL
jgi:hypothetical protein